MENRKSVGHNEEIVLKHDFLEINTNKAIMAFYVYIKKKPKNVPYKVSKSINSRAISKASQTITQRHGQCL